MRFKIRGILHQKVHANRIIAFRNSDVCEPNCRLQLKSIKNAAIVVRCSIGKTILFDIVSCIDLNLRRILADKGLASSQPTDSPNGSLAVATTCKSQFLSRQDSSKWWRLEVGQKNPGRCWVELGFNSNVPSSNVRRGLVSQVRLSMSTWLSSSRHTSINIGLWSVVETERRRWSPRGGMFRVRLQFSMPKSIARKRATDVTCPERIGSGGQSWIEKAVRLYRWPQDQLHLIVWNHPSSGWHRSFPSRIAFRRTRLVNSCYRAWKIEDWTNGYHILLTII